ncbi:MAG: hypothetical protein QXO32_01760 [Candidatus Bathyarchaeia archaeon]
MKTVRTIAVTLREIRYQEKIENAFLKATGSSEDIIEKLLVGSTAEDRPRRADQPVLTLREADLVCRPRT